MVPLREARHARDVHCNLMARKDARRRFHISSLRAVHSPPSISICGATNGCDPSILFVNTTEGLIVMAFKLCQEGNWEPLIEPNRSSQMDRWNRNACARGRSRMRHNLARSCESPTFKCNP